MIFLPPKLIRGAAAAPDYEVVVSAKTAVAPGAQRVRDVKIIAGAEWNPVVTDDFILMPNPGRCDRAKTYCVVFTASPIL